MEEGSTEKIPFTYYSKSHNEGGGHHHDPPPVVQRQETKSTRCKDSDPPQRRGLSVLKASMFVIGECAGSGIMAIPHAMLATGYTGIPLSIVVGFVALYTSVLLGRCWRLILSRHLEYQNTHLRHPYAVIGQLTFGTPGRVIVSFFGNLHLFCNTVVYVVMSSQLIQSLLENILDVRISFCYLQPIIVLVLLPFTCLGTPKDMWLIAGGAACSTLVGVVVMFYIMATDSQKVDVTQRLPYPTPDMFGTVQSLGILTFAYGGHSAFPVLISEMEDPGRWGLVSGWSFGIMTVLYTAMGLFGYLVYGATVNGNVLLSASPGFLLYIVQILVTIHVMCAFVVVINPVVQEFEELLKMRKEFSWRRVLSRSVVVMASLFMAQTIPTFDSLVALFGSVASTALTFVGPPLFYLRLRQTDTQPTSKLVPLHIRAIVAEIVIVYVIIGVLGAVSALVSLYQPGSLSLPCYIDIEAAGT